MALKQTVTNIELKENYELNHMWLLGGSVGWGNYNFYDDVMLIQYLINKCAGKKVLETDGVFGQKTWKAIKKFQDSINKYTQFNCRVDGRVSDRRSGDPVHTGNGQNFTIHLLNYVFYVEKTIYYDDLRRDPDFPVELMHICMGFE